MKRSISILLVLGMALSLTACGQKAVSSPAPKDITRGLLNQSDEELASEDVYKDMKVSYGFRSVSPTRKTVEYDTVQNILLALKTGKIDYMYMPITAARYAIAQDKSLHVLLYPIYIYRFRMAVKKENTALCEKLDNALEALKQDGTVDQLIQTYITDMSTEAVPLPVFDGAETITVATTGDYPPMDYISADGSPAGFNVALLAALARQLQVNIKIVPCETNARLNLLQSGRADAVFWICDGATYGEDYEFKTVNATHPYYAVYDSIVYKDADVKDILNSVGWLD